MTAEAWAVSFMAYGALAALTLLVLYRVWRRRRAALLAAQPEEPRDYDHWSVSDTRPDDIEVCSHCKGAGEAVVSQDFTSGALNIEGCVRCKGSGLDPAQVPHWAVA